MEFNDDLFNSVKKKTNVSKEDLISIAGRLNEGSVVGIPIISTST